MKPTAHFGSRTRSIDPRNGAIAPLDQPIRVQVNIDGYSARLFRSIAGPPTGETVANSARWVSTRAHPNAFSWCPLDPASHRPLVRLLRNWSTGTNLMRKDLWHARLTKSLHRLIESIRKEPGARLIGRKIGQGNFPRAARRALEAGTDVNEGKCIA